ncbi:MAG: NADH-quinone oxidoreductase subunit C [Planctomycetes bacterium]|nr:NADH-quinone oxidoreductase subunit C [Planctomycetota bacterium]
MVESATVDVTRTLPFERIASMVKAKFGDLVDAHPVSTDEAAMLDPYVEVKDPARMAEVAAWLKVEPALRFDSLMTLAGWDDREHIGLTYCLYSYDTGCKLNVRVTFAGREVGKMAVPTVETTWGVANYFEREAYDLYGIQFTSHSDLRRIMLPEDWVGHPGRKDYRTPEEYRGVPHLRDGQFFGIGKDEPKPKPKTEKKPAPPATGATTVAAATGAAHAAGPADAPTTGAPAGETPEQKKARLLAEAKARAAGGKAGAAPAATVTAPTAAAAPSGETPEQKKARLLAEAKARREAGKK